jgi:hypothetical protein
MKRLLLLSTLLTAAIVVTAQKDLSGSYGYSFPPPINNHNNKEDVVGPNGNLVLLKMDGNKYRFWLEVTIGPPSYNRGETDGTLTFVNDTASFDNTYEESEKPCILKFKITGTTIHINSLSTSFNCGFGNGVNADGDYSRLKTQPALNNDWLKKTYFQSPTIIITAKKAELFQDENCRHSFLKSQYFVKDDSLLGIAETEKTVYTEFITPAGKFVYGWLKKTDLKVVDSD